MNDKNKPNPEHELFGSSCGGSRWFNAEPILVKKRMVPMQVRWVCPITDCGGEMKSNGHYWPTGTPGYHHACNKCGFVAALRGKQYPCIEYVEEFQEDPE